MPQPTSSFGSVTMPNRQASSSSAPLSPTRSRANRQSSSSATTATTLGSTVPENGNIFTVTNIYTYADNGQSKLPPPPKISRVESFVEVFDSPTTPYPVGSAANMRELFSSSSTSRSTHTKTEEIFHFDSPRTQLFADANSSLAAQRFTGTPFALV